MVFYPEILLEEHFDHSADGATGCFLGAGGATLYLALALYRSHSSQDFSPLKRYQVWPHGVVR